MAVKLSISVIPLPLSSACRYSSCIFKIEKTLALAGVHLQVTEIAEIDFFHLFQKRAPAFYIAAFHLKRKELS